MTEWSQDLRSDASRIARAACLGNTEYLLKILKRASVVVVAGAALVMGGAGAAFAGAGADGVAVGSPGVLSGNLIQIPVHVPINVCGNSIGVISVLNPAFGNVCANVDGDSHHKPAGHPGVTPGHHQNDKPGHKPDKYPSDKPGHKPAEEPCEYPSDKPAQNPGHTADATPGHGGGNQGGNKGSGW